MCILIIKRLMFYGAERVPKELAVSLGQAAHFFDRKVFLRERILPARSARRGPQTVRELVFHKLPHTPGRIPMSEHENSLRRETPCLPCPFPSRPPKKPLPPVKVKFASDWFANSLVATA